MGCFDNAKDYQEYNKVHPQDTLDIIPGLPKLGLFLCGSVLSNGENSHFCRYFLNTHLHTQFSHPSLKIWKESSAFLDVSHFFLINDIYQTKGK